jgi:anti-sigma factor RsiW
MKCIDTDILQKYLDGEASTDEKTGVEAHLKSCDICTFRLTQLQGRAERVKWLLSSSLDAEAALPPLPSNLNGKLSVNVSGVEALDEPRVKRPLLKRWTIGLSAACILGLVFLYKPLVCRGENQEMVRMQREIVEVDANSPYSQQETVMTIVDESGNVTYME